MALTKAELNEILNLCKTTLAERHSYIADRIKTLVQAKLASPERYTLIAYRKNGVQTCRGCVVDRWDSDFKYETNLTREEVIQKLAECRVTNQEGGAYDDTLVYVEDPEEFYSADIHQAAWALVPGLEEKAKQDIRDAVAAQREREAVERREFERLVKKFAGEK